MEVGGQVGVVDGMVDEKGESPICVAGAILLMRVSASDVKKGSRVSSVSWFPGQLEGG